MNKWKSFSTVSQSKWFWALVSLLSAVMLWLYVTSTEGVTIEKDFNGVKVELLGVEELQESNGLIVTSEDRSTVDLTLSGLRRDIGKLSTSNLSVVVDLSTVRAEGHYTMSYDISFPGNVPEDAVTLVSHTPDTVHITVDRYITRTVEVMGSFTGSTAEGYTAEDTLSFDPLVVKISGPKSEVENVECAWVSITREDVDSTISYASTYDLLDKNGEVVDTANITLETPEVNVTLNVLTIKTVELKAAIIEGGGATSADTVVEVEPKTIMLAGTAEALASVNQIVVDTVRLANVSSVYEATDLLIGIPNDTVNMSGVDTASVRVEVQGLTTRSLSVPMENIVFTNLSDGYSVELITESLPVIIRAAESDLEGIGDANLRGTVDLSELSNSVGIFNVPVKISVDGYPVAGAVGEYKVYIRLSH